MFVWKKIGDHWFYLTELLVGLFLHIIVADEPLRLFLAAILPDGASWRLSMLRDGVHSEKAFLTSEAAQQYAEQAFKQSLNGIDWICPPSFDEPFDEPFHEIAALLAITTLTNGMQISHISEYKREWIAVCVTGEQIDDYAFTRDSDGLMGMRLQQNRLDVHGEV